MSKRVSPPPLSDQDYTAINGQLGDLARLQQEIAQAAAAGCDVTDAQSHCSHLQQQLEAIKRAYFPGRP